MIETPTLRHDEERVRIGLLQEHEADYWARTLGLTREQLEAVVGEVGNRVVDVRARLKHGL